MWNSKRLPKTRARYQQHNKSINQNVGSALIQASASYTGILPSTGLSSSTLEAEWFNTSDAVQASTTPVSGFVPVAGYPDGHFWVWSGPPWRHGMPPEHKWNIRASDLYETGLYVSQPYFKNPYENVKLVSLTRDTDARDLPTPDQPAKLTFSYEIIPNLDVDMAVSLDQGIDPSPLRETVNGEDCCKYMNTGVLFVGALQDPGDGDRIGVREKCQKNGVTWRECVQGISTEMVNKMTIGLQGNKPIVADVLHVRSGDTVVHKLQQAIVKCINRRHWTRLPQPVPLPVRGVGAFYNNMLHAMATPINNWVYPYNQFGVHAVRHPSVTIAGLDNVNSSCTADVVNPSNTARRVLLQCLVDDTKKNVNSRHHEKFCWGETIRRYCIGLYGTCRLDAQVPGFRSAGIKVTVTIVPGDHTSLHPDNRRDRLRLEYTLENVQDLAAFKNLSAIPSDIHAAVIDLYEAEVERSATLLFTRQAKARKTDLSTTTFLDLYAKEPPSPILRLPVPRFWRVGNNTHLEEARTQAFISPLSPGGNLEQTSMWSIPECLHTYATIWDELLRDRESSVSNTCGSGRLATLDVEMQHHIDPGTSLIPIYSAGVAAVVDYKTGSVPEEVYHPFFGKNNDRIKPYLLGAVVDGAWIKRYSPTSFTYLTSSEDIVFCDDDNYVTCYNDPSKRCGFWRIYRETGLIPKLRAEEHLGPLPARISDAIRIRSCCMLFSGNDTTTTAALISDSSDPECLCINSRLIPGKGLDLNHPTEMCFSEYCQPQTGTGAPWVPEWLHKPADQPPCASQCKEMQGFIAETGVLDRSNTRRCSVNVGKYNTVCEEKEPEPSGCTRPDEQPLTHRRYRFGD